MSNTTIAASTIESGTRTAVKIVIMLFEGPLEAVLELDCVVGVEGSAAGTVANDDSDCV